MSNRLQKWESIANLNANETVRVQTRLSKSGFAHDHFEMDKTFDKGDVPSVLGFDEKRSSMGSDSDSDLSFKCNGSFEEISISKPLVPSRI